MVDCDPDADADGIFDAEADLADCDPDADADGIFDAEADADAEADGVPQTAAGRRGGVRGRPGSSPQGGI